MLKKGAGDGNGDACRNLLPLVVVLPVVLVVLVALLVAELLRRK